MAPADARALQGRVILITGAHGGLGRAAAIACGRAGASLVLLGRKVPRLERLHDQLAGQGIEASLYPLDLEGATPDDYLEMAQRIEQGMGRLDGVLHCAAACNGLTPLEHTDPAVFARELHVNLTARWWLSQACLPLLARADDAALVFLIDDTGPASVAYRGAYGLAQHAQQALVATLHAETAQSHVRVSGFRPGPMRTPLRARAFVADEDRKARDPAVFAATCVELLSPAGAAHRGRILEACA